MSREAVISSEARALIRKNIKDIDRMVYAVIGQVTSKTYAQVSAAVARAVDDMVKDEQRTIQPDRFGGLSNPVVSYGYGLVEDVTISARSESYVGSRKRERFDIKVDRELASEELQA